MLDVRGSAWQKPYQPPLRQILPCRHTDLPISSPVCFGLKTVKEALRLRYCVRCVPASETSHGLLPMTILLTISRNDERKPLHQQHTHGRCGDSRIFHWHASRQTAAKTGLDSIDNDRSHNTWYQLCHTRYRQLEFVCNGFLCINQLIN